VSELGSLYPFESRFAQIDGCRMHYIDEGSGPVVVLLHGNPTWSFYYRNLISDLATSFRVIAPDHIGLGLSDHPSDRTFRAADRVRHIEELIAILRLDKFSLVMHDWGGAIGTGVALNDPNRIEKLIYFNTTISETESLPRIIKRATRPFIGRFITKFSTKFIDLTTRLGVVRPLSSEVLRGYRFPYKTSKERKAIWDFVSDIPFDSNHPTYKTMLDTAENIHKLNDKPVLVIWGLRDPCFHRGMLNHVRSHFPSATVVEIPHASHLVLEDAPDDVIPRVRAFLNNEPVAPLKILSDVEGAGVNPLYEALCYFAKEIPDSHVSFEVTPSWDRISYSPLTYRDFFLRVQQYRRGLTHEGVVPGSKVLMLIPPGEEFLAFTYAIMGNGATPVFVDPGVGKDNLYKCISDLAPDFLVGSPQAFLLKFLKPRLFKNTRKSFLVSRLPGFGVTTGMLRSYSTAIVDGARTDAPVMVAFTSGATGTPKGVVFTHEMLKAQLSLFKDVFGLMPNEKDLPLLAIFSVFNVALGRTSVFVPMNHTKPISLDPQLITRVIKDLSIASSFGSPTLWNKIGEYLLRYSETLPSIKTVLMAGAPVSEKVLKLVQSCVPNGKALTPYGATEALPVTTCGEIKFERAKSGELGTYVGLPVPGVRIKIVHRKSGEQLAPYEIGDVLVSGVTVSPRYLNRPDANRASKIQDGESFWHRMGDCGYVDSEGGLYFCGRTAHVVEAEGRVYYPIPVEKIFNQHPKVRRSALIFARSIKSVAVAIEPFPGVNETNFRDELKELAKSDPLTDRINAFFFFDEFPVDGRHNAKIFRDKLGEMA
jgi:acyl-CoA synthetase (AMP-forming)/AMP-acid ligase II/pimeloyl-ACP methyl ester carboxylesterase